MSGSTKGIPNPGVRDASRAPTGFSTEEYRRVAPNPEHPQRSAARSGVRSWPRRRRPPATRTGAASWLRPSVGELPFLLPYVLPIELPIEQPVRRYALRRRRARMPPSPASPRPSSVIVAGSGVTVA